jgi:tetratricopeptide (TPR) repeat protein
MSLPRAALGLKNTPATTGDTTTLDPKTLEARAQQASAQQHYAEAAALYEALSRVKTIAIQDDAMPLLTAARSYAQVGQHDKAIALWERVLTIPAAPDAHPPALMPGPVDFRGEARWGIAESRRAQGRWSEALELYRLNRTTYPRDDGCVPSGAANQTMALVEGVCLENLGRYNEAVELYWPAAMHLSASIPPLAMRRLIDLYAAAGQMAVLEAAAAREAKAFPVQFRLRYLGKADAELRDYDQKLLEHELVYSSIPTFERIHRFRKAARERRWDILLAALQYKPNEHHETALDHEIPLWQRREAMSAMAMVSVEAMPVLQHALQRDAANPYLQAALILGSPPEQKRLRLAKLDLNSEVSRVLQEAMGYDYGTMSLQFSKLPFTLRLPSQLPPVFRTSVEN